MKKKHSIKSVSTFKLLAACVFGLGFQPVLQADVVVLQDGKVLTGNVLQQDDEGVLIQTASGTYRYPPSWLRDVRKEPAAAPHVSNNGQRIPDWAQIVTLLAKTGWSRGLKQIPATMIESGNWKNVPYISFQCRSGGYELNIYGDLNNPAAVQIGAMSYLKDSDEARSNCVNFICSVLANADDRKVVRALNWNQKGTEKNGDMIFETILPGEWGSYGGWWVSVYGQTALASARASDAELLTLRQPVVSAAQSAVVAAQPAAPAPGAADQSGAAPAQPAATTTTTEPAVVTTYPVVPTWSEEELALARATPGPYPGATPYTPGPRPAAAPNYVYPRTYSRTGGTYGYGETRRR